MSPIREAARPQSGTGLDIAARLTGGGGLGLTLDLQVIMMRHSYLSTIYPAVGTFSRVSVLTGADFALVRIFLLARIPWMERGVCHDDVNQIMKTFVVVDGSGAISGDYEKGVHKVDLHTGLIAIGTHSVSVVCPDEALYAAQVKTFIVGGRDAQRWKVARAG